MDGPDEAIGERLYSRREILQRSGGVLAGAALSGAFAFQPTGHADATEPAGIAAGQRVVVDVSAAVGGPTYAATGFLHGLSRDASRPPDELLLPLKPQLFREGGSVLPGGAWAKGGYEGYKTRFQEVRDNYNRVCRPPYDAELTIVMSDLWGAEGVTLQPSDPYPGDGGDWSSYEAFVAQVVRDVKAAGMDGDRIHYEIWNEPDFRDLYFPRPQAQYEETWRRGVRQIRDLDPLARISGPTFTRMTTSGVGGHMDDWLDMTLASGTPPDILSWHAIIPGQVQDPVEEARLARKLLAERGLAHVQLELNEYLSPDQLNPGYNAWHIARLQRAGIEYAALAIYGPCCTFPLLDGLLTEQDGVLRPTAQWWAHERYASITGTLVSTSPSSDVDAVAGADPDRRRVRVLLGNKVGSRGEVGPVTVMIERLGSAHRYLNRRGRVPVRLERLPNEAVLEAPEAVQDLAVKPVGNRVAVTIPWHDGESSYVITLGEHETELPPYAIVSVSPAELLLLPETPSSITIRVRNYTDDPIALEPQVSAPQGYTVATADTLTVPANGDAELVVTVTRTASLLDPGELRVTLGEEAATAALRPTDNWARIAEMSASSTYTPSSPDNLNDGSTNSELWGGGGANGWNDETPGVFPDSVTASWTQPVRLGRVMIYTLDSRAYPAASWGVRDYDVEARVGGSWRVVAVVRDNTSGAVESLFPAVEADALRIVIRDSNDHAYSRLVEIEAYSG
jgi:hypothetical protein